MTKSDKGLRKEEKEGIWGEEREEQKEEKRKRIRLLTRGRSG